MTITHSSSGTQQGPSEKAKKPNKITPDRAKLCNQLRIRLQYAKLKVERGWTRQNLSEVENLYFFYHHSDGQQRSPSSFSRQPTLSGSDVLFKDRGASRVVQIEAQTSNLSIPRTIYTDVAQNSEFQKYDNYALRQSPSTDEQLRLDSFATNITFESHIAPVGESFSSLQISSPSPIPLNIQEAWRHDNGDIRRSCDRSCCTTPTPTGSSSASSLKGSSLSLPIATDRLPVLVVPAQPQFLSSLNASSSAALDISVNQSWTCDSFWSTLPRFAGHLISNDPAPPYSRTAQ